MQTPPSPGRPLIKRSKPNAALRGAAELQLVHLVQLQLCNGAPLEWYQDMRIAPCMPRALY